MNLPNNGRLHNMIEVPIEKTQLLLLDVGEVREDDSSWSDSQNQAHSELSYISFIPSGLYCFYFFEHPTLELC